MATNNLAGVRAPVLGGQFKLVQEHSFFYRMFTGCLPDVYRMFTGCLPDVYRMHAMANHFLLYVAANESIGT
jgi:hypothetical protein